MTLLRLIFGLLAAVFSCVATLGVREAHGEATGAWDLVLENAASLPYTLHVAMPLVLCGSALSARWTGRYWVRLRYGSASHSWWGTAKRSASLVTFVWLGQLGGVIVASLGLRLAANGYPPLMSSEYLAAGIAPALGWLQLSGAHVLWYLGLAVTVVTVAVTVSPAAGSALAAVLWGASAAATQFAWPPGNLLNALLGPLPQRSGLPDAAVIGCLAAGYFGLLWLLARARDRERLRAEWSISRSLVTPAVWGSLVVAVAVLTQGAACREVSACVAAAFPGVGGSVLQLIAWVLLPVIAVLHAAGSSVDAVGGALAARQLRFGAALRELRAAHHNSAARIAALFACWAATALAVAMVLASDAPEWGRIARVMFAVFVQGAWFAQTMVLLFHLLVRRCAPHLVLLSVLATSVALQVVIPESAWIFAGWSGARFAALDGADQFLTTVWLVAGCCCVYFCSLSWIRGAIPGVRRRLDASSQAESGVEVVQAGARALERRP